MVLKRRFVCTRDEKKNPKAQLGKEPINLVISLAPCVRDREQVLILFLLVYNFTTPGTIF